MYYIDKIKNLRAMQWVFIPWKYNQRTIPARAFENWQKLQILSSLKKPQKEAVIDTGAMP